MSETTNETVQDNVQEVATDSQNEVTETPDVGSVIQESKKYRKRAQDIEAKYNELQSQLEKAEEQKLVEEKKYEELSNKYKNELDGIMPDYERLKKAENAYKEELLDRFPEEERDAMSSLTVEQLRIIDDKMNKVQDLEKEVPSTSSTPARASNPSNKNWVDMNSEERRANWGSILQSYVKR